MLRPRALFVLALLCAAPARAATARFLLDGTVGMAVPLGDATYRNTFDPWATFGLDLGAEVWLTRRLALAPEIELDGGPWFQRNTSAVSTGVFRFRPGLRVLFGFGRGHAFFLRALVGGEALLFGPGGRLGAGSADVGFAAEGGAGLQFRVGARAVVGFVVGAPVGLHRYRTSHTEVNSDFALRFFVGYRR